MRDCSHRLRKQFFCDDVFAVTAMETMHWLNMGISDTSRFYAAHVNDGMPDAFDAIALAEFMLTEKRQTHDPVYAPLIILRDTSSGFPFKLQYVPVSEKCTSR